MLAGDKVNVIWGTVTQDNFDNDEIVVTLIAAGMSDDERTHKNIYKTPVNPPFVHDLNRSTAERTAESKRELVFPEFLQEYQNRKRKK